MTHRGHSRKTATAAAQVYQIQIAAYNRTFQVSLIFLLCFALLALCHGIAVVTQTSRKRFCSITRIESV